MLIAGAVCPHPPLLIPAALGSAASDPPAELRKVAGAAGQAVSGLAGGRPDLIVVVGGGAAEREYGADASGGLHAFGVGVTVGPGEPVLPLSLTVGRWLLERAGILARGEAPAPEAGLVGAGAGLPGETAGSPPGELAGPPGEPAGIPGDAGPPGERAGIAGAGGTLGEPAGITEETGILGEAVSSPGTAKGEGESGGGGIAVVFQEVARNAAAGACLKLGRILADRAPRVALLAMGDSSARPAREDPDVPDPAAEDYDGEVAEALAAADARWLARLDPALDDELVVAGRAAWQVLAGAAGGTRLQGRLLCMSAPYGVTYLVASWEPCRAD
jgi:hypothetical protein